MICLYNRLLVLKLCKNPERLKLPFVHFVNGIKTNFFSESSTLFLRLGLFPSLQTRRQSFKKKGGDRGKTFIMPLPIVLDGLQIPKQSVLHKEVPG